MKRLLLFAILFALLSINVKSQFYNIEGLWKSTSSYTFKLSYNTNNNDDYVGLIIKNTRTGDVFYADLKSSTYYVAKEYKSSTGSYYTKPYSNYYEYQYKIHNCFNITVTTYVNSELYSVHKWVKL